MYLKRIELLGFKSFADQSVIEFMPGITGIVGPNGCGKSNIADAFRWVLGEQSAKSLRGSSMSDIIFAGSEDRSPENLAEVTLVFNNEDHFMNIEYNEVQITRRLYRINNESEYLINNQNCRLKDIVDLMMDTGMGRDSLSIISQGNISSFADSKPEERRGMFEEAAGVSKYKKRKIESIRKLERTKENLERSEDICLELERQIEPLKRQKEKAETYLDLKEELKSVEVNVLIREIKTLSEELEALNKQYDTLEKDQLENDNAIIINESQNETLRTKIFDLDSEINQLQTDLLASMNKLNSLNQRKIEIDASRKQLLESNDQQLIQEKISELKQLLKEKIAQYNDRVSRYKKIKQERKDLDDDYYQNNQEIKKLRAEVEDLQFKVHSLRSRKTQLVDFIENKSNYSAGVRNILKARQSLNGIVGTLGDLLRCEEDYEEALSASLGGASQFIVMKTERDAKDAIAFLKRNNAGRATFIPLTNIKPRYIMEEHLFICDHYEGYLGKMSDFVRTNQGLEVLVKYQLGNILLCETIDDALSLSKALNNRYRIVTLEGELINIGGSLTGGRYKDHQSSSVNNRELKVVNSDLKRYETLLNDKKKKINDLEAKARELSHYSLQKNISIAKLEVEISTMKDELEINKSEYETLTHQHVELSQLESGQTSNELIDEINETQQLKDELTETIQAKRQTRMAFVNENDDIEKNLKVQRKNSLQYQNEMRDLSVKKVKLENEINNDLLRLNDEYKMTYEYASEHYHQDLEIEEAKEKVRELRRNIENLGSVNLESIEQYKDVSSRYQTLNEQRMDLISAQETLLKAIEEMDRIMIKRFDETFNAINKEFNTVFRSLFGGGRASLKYSDPDNILETGIDIDVQPPGKSVQNISLFSGGEKALIAISCLFAILRVRPVPMCILDEVEAALDFSNVERFAKFLREFSKDTQFIVITHREGTMEECDLLYGATMQQKGVTQLVSVKLKDALSMANES